MTLISKGRLCGLVLGGLLLIGADAQAARIDYVTTGVFIYESEGVLVESSTYLDAANGIQISFEGSFDDFVTTPIGVTTQTSFGTFDTSGTVRPPGSNGGNFGPVSATFRLDIFQTLVDLQPAFGTLEFVGSLTGQLHSEASQAWIQFDGPLEQTLLSESLPVIYGIANADRAPGSLTGTPGRVNIAPPSTNDGVTTLIGEITPIPEPSTMILLGMGAVAPLALTVRNRRKARASA